MSAERLTHGRAAWLIRLVGLVSLLFALAGAALLLAPVPRPPPPAEVTRAVPRLPADEPLLFAQYGELKAERGTPFAFQELAVAEVALRSQEPESAPTPTPTPTPTPAPAPAPNTEGLTLIGTAPGSARGYAVLSDQQSGLVSTVARGDLVRDAVIEEIYPDRVVLVLGGERAELRLAALPGSENLDRQLQGLPPLPGQQTAAASRPAPAPVPVAGTAVLAGAQASPGSAVITQAPAPAPAAQAAGTEPSQSSAGQPSNAGTQTDSQTGAGGQASAGAQTQSGQAPAGGQTPAGERPRRSLGISGHMLGLEQQQELGLQQTGLLVTAVRRDGSPIQTGDVILSIDGQSFDSVGDAQALIQGASSDSVQLELFSNGANKPVSVNLTQG